MKIIKDTLSISVMIIAILGGSLVLAQTQEKETIKFPIKINPSELEVDSTGRPIIVIDKSQIKLTTTKTPLADSRIEFDHTTWDFGSIEKGAMVTHNYWLSNTGTDTLVVTKIKAACGCTSTRKGGFSVAPGESSTIDIVFDSKKFNGRVTKSVNIECNDKINPYLDLRFKAVINNPLLRMEYSPLQVDFGNVKMGTKKKTTVMISNIDSTLSKLSIIERPSEEFVKLKISDDELKPDQVANIELTLQDNLEATPIMTTLTLEFENKPGSRVSIPIKGVIFDENATPTQAEK